MNYIDLKTLKDKVKSNLHLIPKETYESFTKSFDIDYSHNSTAIEGNSLSLIETKAILEDGLSIGGKELREIYEVINHNKAFDFVKKCIQENKPLDENIIKEIHSILMENIFSAISGGVYRNSGIRITGASHRPPEPNEMYYQIKDFYYSLNEKSSKYNPIELAAYTHAEFVRIHPFPDGNGRTSRLIMNYQLMHNGYMPISIQNKDKLNYYNALEEYAVNNNLESFTKIIFDLEHQKLNECISLIPNHFLSDKKPKMTNSEMENATKHISDGLDNNQPLSNEERQ